MSLFFGTDTKDIGSANACVLGLCWDKSSSFRRGSAKAPRMIRDYTSSKLYNPYTEAGVNIKDHWRIYDLGDVDPPSIIDAIPMVKDVSLPALQERVLNDLRFIIFKMLLGRG